MCVWAGLHCFCTVFIPSTAGPLVPPPPFLPCPAALSPPVSPMQVIADEDTATWWARGSKREGEWCDQVPDRLTSSAVLHR